MAFYAVNVANAHTRIHTQKANTAKFARICVFFGADNKLYYRQDKNRLEGKTDGKNGKTAKYIHQKIAKEKGKQVNLAKIAFLPLRIRTHTRTPTPPPTTPL